MKVMKLVQSTYGVDKSILEVDENGLYKLIEDTKKEAAFHQKYTKPIPSISLISLDTEYFEQFL